MAQQTAMQELIEWLEVGWKDEDAETIIKKANQLLPTEKEHISKAWDAGYYGYFSLGIREIEFNNGEEYYDINYNETYNK